MTSQALVFFSYVCNDGVFSDVFLVTIFSSNDNSSVDVFSDFFMFDVFLVMIVLASMFLLMVFK